MLGLLDGMTLYTVHQ